MGPRNHRIPIAVLLLALLFEPALLTAPPSAWAQSEERRESSAAAPGEKALTVTVAERAGVERKGEYVTFGVPIPRAWNVKDAARLRVCDAGGKAIPAQLEALARWGAADRIRRIRRTGAARQHASGSARYPGSSARTRREGGPHRGGEMGVRRCGEQGSREAALDHGRRLRQG